MGTYYANAVLNGLNGQEIKVPRTKKGKTSLYDIDAYHFLLLLAVACRQPNPESGGKYGTYTICKTGQEKFWLRLRMKDTKFGEICKELMAIGLLEHSKTIKMDKISPEVREGLTGPQYAYRVSLKAIRPFVRNEQEWRKMLGLYKKDDFTPEEMDELCLTPHVMDDDRTRNTGEPPRNTGEPPRNAGESPRNTGTYKNNTRRDNNNIKGDDDVVAISGFNEKQFEWILGVVAKAAGCDVAGLNRRVVAQKIAGLKIEAIQCKLESFNKRRKAGEFGRIGSKVGLLLKELADLPRESVPDSSYGEEIPSREDAEGATVTRDATGG